ncbi:hypothetical protein LA080_015284 [Diaporthe eres]|nr:hypothetical protein LA080_015284 [Diaporthe eres]
MCLVHDLRRHLIFISRSGGIAPAPQKRISPSAARCDGDPSGLVQPTSSIKVKLFKTKVNKTKVNKTKVKPFKTKGERIKLALSIASL